MKNSRPTTRPKRRCKKRKKRSKRLRQNTSNTESWPTPREEFQEEAARECGRESPLLGEGQVLHQEIPVPEQQEDRSVRHQVAVGFEHYFRQFQRQVEEQPHEHLIPGNLSRETLLLLVRILFLQ